MDDVIPPPTITACLVALSGQKHGQPMAITAAGMTLKALVGISGAEIPAVRVYLAPAGRVAIKPLTGDVKVMVNDAIITAPRLLTETGIVTVDASRYRLEINHQRSAPWGSEAHNPTGPAANLERAKDLFSEGDYQQAASLYKAATTFPATAAAATYGLGVCALKAGDSTTATEFFNRSLQIQPSNANAHYYLGYIAEQQGNVAAAVKEYNEAVSRNPRHTLARQRLQRLSSPPAEGIYAILGTSTAPEAKQAETLARKLETERSARKIAYVGYYWPRLFLLFLVATILEFGGIHLIQSDVFVRLLKVHPSGVTNTTGTQLMILVCIISQIAVIAYAAWVVIRASFTSYRFFQGRFQIEHGVMFRKITNINLWQLRNILLKRTLVNVLTGDGAVVFVIPPEDLQREQFNMSRPPKGKVIAVGFDHGSSLLGSEDSPGSYRDMLTLSTLMRAISAWKGIVQ